ncbi:MAG: hypothetical protein NVSMB27_33540 [Ktedonobacteraceae bacterium]
METIQAKDVAILTSELIATLESMADGACIYDEMGNILYMNAAQQELLGVQSIGISDLATTPLTLAPLAPTRGVTTFQHDNPMMFPGDEHGQLLPREQWPVSRILNGEVLKGATAMDIMLCTEDGREVMLNVSGAPVCDSQGSIVGAVTVLRDVTERRWLEMRTREVLSSVLAMTEVLVQTFDAVEGTGSAEEEVKPIALRKVGQRLVELTHNLLECQRIGFASIDAESGLMCPIAVVGLSAQHEEQWWLEVQSSKLSDYFHPDVLAHLLAGEEVVMDLTKQAPINRSTYGVTILLIVPISAGNHLTGMLEIEQGSKKHEYTAEELVLIRTVARLAALLIERERLQREQRQALTNELALREINQRMNEFLSIASHELRTPLTLIKGNVQLAERQLNRFVAQGEIEPEQLSRQIEKFREQIDQADGQAVCLDRLISDLLDVSRTQTGKLEMRAKPCDLAKIVHEAVAEQRLMDPARLILWEFVHQGAQSKVPIVADADRIRQVVMNYLANAIKYSADDQPVEVYLKVEGSAVCVSVQDKGIGIPVWVQERVWERFYRVEGNAIQSGLGLGLHICKMIIEWHQGEVGVQSLPGVGSIFWFTLPLAK